MQFEEYLAEQRQDPEYLVSEGELTCFLDLAGDVLDLRMEKGWSQTDLARKVGTKQSSISRLENGLANPTLKYLHRLAQALGAVLEIRLRTPGEALPPTDALSQDRAQGITFTLDPQSMPDA